MDKKEKLQMIIRHIKRVEDNCNKLAQDLVKEDEQNFYFGVKLVQAGRVHDASKFDIFEFEHLNKESDLFTSAIFVHHSKNGHHPQYWQGGINAMPDLYIAEMVCDCLARGQEMGTDTREFFAEEATKRYGFKMDDRVGQLITKYLDLLLTPTFK